MPTPATRLITLILLLQHKPGQKASMLAAELGISIRTLHRYFGMLDEMGIPVYAERGPYGGFSLVPGYRLPPLIFTPEEAVALSLGTGLVREMWGQLYIDAALGAEAKLENVLPPEQRREIAWARNSLLATGINRADMEKLTPCLTALRKAIKDNRQVTMVYQSGRSSNGEERNVDLYGLFHRSGWWYAVGFCHLRHGLRTFRVDRIVDVRINNQAFSKPVDFDLHEYVARDWEVATQIVVNMLFKAQIAHLAQYARGYWDSLEEQPDGSILVTFQAPDIYAAASHALSYGPGVEVLEPAEVSRTVHDWAQATADMYLKHES